MGISGLVVALGNPGRRYLLTRHNAGFLLADYMREQEEAWCRPVAMKKAEAWECTFGYDQSPWLFLKPQTYMNRSGESLRPLRKKVGVDPEKMIVLHDELDLPFGTLRFKTGGGLAGHKGLKSLAEVLGSRDFHRIRIGIGRPEEGMSVTDYVLTRFTPEEMQALPSILESAARGLRLFLTGRRDEAVAQLHTFRPDESLISGQGMD